METDRIVVIDCGHLYRAMGGYDFQGGKYSSAERVLYRNGWRYDIKTDCWFDPKSIN